MATYLSSGRCWFSGSTCSSSSRMKAQALSSNMGVGSWELGGEEHWGCAPCGTDGPDYSESRRETRLCEMATMINSRFSRLHKVQSQWKGAERWHWKMFQIYLLDVNIDHNCIYKLLQTRTMTIKHCIFLVCLLSKIRLITWWCDFGIVSYESAA